MKFYNRENELALLTKIEKQSRKSAQMTFVVGRRRIGKTTLLVKANEGKVCLYFFVSKKNEGLLCSEFVEEIKEKLGVPIFGEFKNFKEVFGLIMEISKKQNFTLIIDEFQEFMSINSSIYSDMQHIWDIGKNDSKINLILCGSVYSLMKRIFENSNEPLFGRATHRIHIKAFDIKTLNEIYCDYSSKHLPEDIFVFYMITGGVAKYVELLVQAEAFTLEEILNEIFSENSLFLEEGKNMMIEEFGKDYGNYFSILSLIASGKTSRVEIESILEIQTGGFLEKLENEYGLVSKVRPILSKVGSRSVKYKINDNFLRFWFRFIFKYKSAVEIGNFEYLMDIVRRDYAAYSGNTLEKYFTEKLIAEKKYNQIGTYWEKQNQNEIDIVAINDMQKKVLVVEVKRNPENISLQQLKQKSVKLQEKLPGYDFEFLGFSMEDLL